MNNGRAKVKGQPAVNRQATAKEVNSSIMKRRDNKSVAVVGSTTNIKKAQKDKQKDSAIIESNKTQQKLNTLANKQSEDETSNPSSHKSSKQPRAARSQQETSAQKQTSSKKKETSVINQQQRQTGLKAEAAPAVSTSDPMALLMMMEGRTVNSSVPHRPRFASIPSASTSHTVALCSDGEHEQATSSEGESEEMSDSEEVYGQAKVKGQPVVNRQATAKEVNNPVKKRKGNKSVAVIGSTTNIKKARTDSQKDKQKDSAIIESNKTQLKLNKLANKQSADETSNPSSHKPSKQPRAARSQQETSAQKQTSSKKKERSVINQQQRQTGGKVEAAPAVSTSDPMALLMMMEGRTVSSSVPDRPSFASIPSASSSHTVALCSDGELEQATSSEGELEEMSDWEDVYDHNVVEKSQIPDGPVEITLEMPDILRHKKRQKKTFDWKAHLARRVKRFKKEVAADMHKVHLLCLLSLGLRQNEALNDVTVTAVILSLLPPEHMAKTKLSVQRQVENMLLWYKRKFTLENVGHCSNIRLVPATSLTDAMAQGTVTDARVWVLIFIGILRVIGLSVRLVLSFQPMRFKAHHGWDEKKGGKKCKHNSGSGSAKGASVVPALTPKTKSDKSSGVPARTPKTKSDKLPSSSKGKVVRAAPKKNPAPERRLSQRESSKKAVLKNKAALKECDDDDGDDRMDDDSDSDFSNSGTPNMKATPKRATQAGNKDDDSSSEEFEESQPSFGKPVRVLKDLKILSNRKILSPSTSDDEAAGGKRHGPLGHDIWLEVYMPDSKKWVCFDCFKSEFGKPYGIENTATQPLLYVLGFKNDDSVKDVTARYAKQWLAHTRKNRIDQQWWGETLLMFDRTPVKENLIEDDEIKGQLLVRPMPTSIGEFKSHPLYALRRHLLKFEAIYPDTAIPVGYVRQEPVYARECVRNLHSRDNWLKEGRLVRLKEHPYKMVKSRPKWNKPKENPDALDLELFGEWQTEEYIPPPAVNGKVPRNEYGNVELFKPWMLPKGTVQVRGQGMQRVAKKLNIDVAAAMVGWDNHSGFSHPVMDGWIVCEEFADTLMAAWLEDQEIQEQREQEKTEKRVYDNWRLLIRGLLIKERLKNKFLLEAPTITKPEKQETFSDEEEAADVQLSWPRNRQDKLAEEKSKIVQEKTERERKLVETARCVGMYSLGDGGEIKCEGKKKKVPVKPRSTSLAGGKRKLQKVVQSESGSSDDEVVDIKMPKVVKGKTKKRRSLEDEDPDFIVCSSQTKLTSSDRSGLAKIITDGDEEGVEGLKKDRLTKGRVSLSRQAKK